MQNNFKAENTPLPSTKVLGKDTTDINMFIPPEELKSFYAPPYLMAPTTAWMAHHPAAMALPPGYRKVTWRKGKWFDEEENYTKKLIEVFSNGYLNLAGGTTLRSFLSERLSCDPMRITKKFAGSSCIGKQVYVPCDPKTDPATIRQAQDELRELEEKFRAKIEAQHALDYYPIAPNGYAPLNPSTLGAHVHSQPFVESFPPEFFNPYTPGLGPSKPSQFITPYYMKGYPGGPGGSEFSVAPGASVMGGVPMFAPIPHHAIPVLASEVYRSIPHIPVSHPEELHRTAAIPHAGKLGVMSSSSSQPLNKTVPSSVSSSSANIAPATAVRPAAHRQSYSSSTLSIPTMPNTTLTSARSLDSIVDMKLNSLKSSSLSRTSSITQSSESTDLSLSDLKTTSLQRTRAKTSEDFDLTASDLLLNFFKAAQSTEGSTSSENDSSAASSVMGGSACALGASIASSCSPTSELESKTSNLDEDIVHINGQKAAEASPKTSKGGEEKCTLKRTSSCIDEEASDQHSAKRVREE
eukprot:gene8725-9612_t